MMLKDKIGQSVASLRSAGFGQYSCGIITGTGLGGLAGGIKTEVEADYSAIPHFPLSTVETHAGKLIGGSLSDSTVLAMCGRFHYYEGYSMAEITFPLYVMKKLGIKYLLISNAAGNLNANWKKGELMLIDDHLNLMPDNPLRGINDDSLGPRFPDMSRPYDEMLSASVEAAAEKLGIVLRRGVYASVPGPNLETRAEYRYLRQIGADAVGMSTVPEVIAANYLGIKVCAISVLTDDCDPDNLKVAEIEEIISLATEGEKKIARLYRHLLAKEKPALT